MRFFSRLLCRPSGCPNMPSHESIVIITITVTTTTITIIIIIISIAIIPVIPPSCKSHSQTRLLLFSLMKSKNSNCATVTQKHA
ncbi:hypothetical protein AWZ03_015094 [Drosophila navojoa]|uniref:Uncharacterized protein n=1 Tax=Drosophila navojoa TaxID=7232 RepID=A0A484APM9_DRONA|nr:hypothetical protein AWZ03_015094 [Drosophila navojoa]